MTARSVPTTDTRPPMFRGAHGPSRATTRAAAVVGAALLLTGAAAGQTASPSKAEMAGRYQQLRVDLKSVPVSARSGQPFVPRGSCPDSIITHTDANFQGGSFAAQAACAEHEAAAASYVL